MSLIYFCANILCTFPDFSFKFNKLTTRLPFSHEKCFALAGILTKLILRLLIFEITLRKPRRSAYYEINFTPPEFVSTCAEITSSCKKYMKMPARCGLDLDSWLVYYFRLTMTRYRVILLLACVAARWFKSNTVSRINTQLSEYVSSIVWSIVMDEVVMDEKYKETN